MELGLPGHMHLQSRRRKRHSAATASLGQGTNLGRYMLRVDGAKVSSSIENLLCGTFTDQAGDAFGSKSAKALQSTMRRWLGKPHEP